MAIPLKVVAACYTIIKYNLVQLSDSRSRPIIMSIIYKSIPNSKL